MSIALLRALARENIVSQEKMVEINSTLKNIYGNNINSEVSLVKFILKNKLITSQDLAKFINRLYGYPLFDLTEYDAKYLLKDVLKEEQISEYEIIPLFKRDNTIFLGVADPTLHTLYKKLLFSTGCDIELIILYYDYLKDFLVNSGLVSSKFFADIESQDPANLFNFIFTDDGLSEDGPIAQFVHDTIVDAINRKASDIHFEFYEFFCRIRYRIDGVLREVVKPPLVIRDNLSSRIKVMCQLDISEKKIPQDGGMKLKIDNDYVNFRVSTLPTQFGEKIVIRILNTDSSALDIDLLGLDDNDKKSLLTTINSPYGMILVTGPTGSGKTQTLYTCLKILNKEEINISTAEDPIEINMEGINQVSINERQGLTFASALRSFLRQDPDVIMVGEIRDLETADIAIKASQTGHLVFSTVHTNDAPATLTRLVNMGVPLYNIASSVKLIIAQRLVRFLCNLCKEKITRPNDTVLRQMGFTDDDLKKDFELYKAVGCRDCKNKGYKGRTGIFEVMVISNNIEAALLANKTEDEIRKLAISEGMMTLRKSVISKVMQGLTSLEEANAKTLL